MLMFGENREFLVNYELHLTHFHNSSQVCSDCLSYLSCTCSGRSDLGLTVAEAMSIYFYSKLNNCIPVVDYWYALESQIEIEAALEMANSSPEKEPSPAHRNDSSADDPNQEPNTHETSCNVRYLKGSKSSFYRYRSLYKSRMSYPHPNSRYSTPSAFSLTLPSYTSTKNQEPLPF